ncbi:hypothetical protein, partial [Streptomyces sp. NPDC008259]|uniref:hypothetical protein n=1 Tax=Streptomyces sp. NPDC008259 TaxID=3364823 RepID=UPI0036EE11FB
MRTVRHSHVLGPHLVDQRIMLRMRKPRTVRRRHIEHIMIPGDRTAPTITIDTEHDPVVNREPALGLVPGHRPGQLMELRGPLIEP